MKKGEVFFALGESDTKHPFIFIEAQGEDNFLGVMLTKSPKYSNNLRMKPEHFKDSFYNNTHLVSAALLKRNDWTVNKVSELSEEGLKFVEDNVNFNSPKYWDARSPLTGSFKKA
jgi:hypothetical protein